MSREQPRQTSRPAGTPAPRGPGAWPGILAIAPTVVAIALLASAPSELLAGAASRPTATAAATSAAASMPAALPAASLPASSPSLMPTTLPPGASLKPTRPVWDPAAGAREPERFYGHGPSTVIIPIQTIPLNFNHKKHLATGLVSCTDCHPKATGSKWSSDWLLPVEKACRGCHKIDRSDFSKKAAPAANCSFCHLGFDESAARPKVMRVSLPPPNLKFPHVVHVTDEKIPCQRCHAGIEETGFADRDVLPRMALCLTACHNGRVAPDACSTCHFTDTDGKLTIEFDAGTLSPTDALPGMAHVPGWEMMHDEIAAADPASCMSCHREEECAICHDGVARPSTIHVGDYALKHAVDARRSDPDCQSCHRLQTFCVTCHARTGVAMAGDGVRGAATEGRFNFHPPQWAADSAVPGHHSYEARKSPVSCVGCHLERDCTACHSELELFCGESLVGAGPCVPGRRPSRGMDSPHPPGFAAHCGRFMKRNVTACLRCHSTTSDRLAECGG